MNTADNIPIQPGSKHAAEILIVDDDRENLLLLMTILQAQGYRVRPVLNGMAALHSVRARTPDLILLDIDMPEMSGYEVCQQLKADVTTRDIPVIFVSGRDDQKDIKHALSVGGVDYIMKPFCIKDILKRVDRHLHRTCEA